MKRTELINLRKKLNMTQEKIAKKAGIKRSYYSLIESGIRNPSLNIALTISNAFNVPLSEAFPREIFFGEKCYKM